MADLITKEVNTSNSMVDDLRRHAGYVERQFPQTAWTLRNIADELQRCAPETSERQEMVVLRPCAIHQGMTFFATVGYRPPLREVCPGCEKWPPEVTSEKALEQPQCSGLCQGHSSEASLSGWLPDANCPVHGLKATLSEVEPR